MQSGDWAETAESSGGLQKCWKSKIQHSARAATHLIQLPQTARQSITYNPFNSILYVNSPFVSYLLESIESFSFVLTINRQKLFRVLSMNALIVFTNMQINIILVNAVDDFIVKDDKKTSDDKYQFIKKQRVLWSFLKSKTIENISPHFKSLTINQLSFPFYVFWLQDILITSSSPSQSQQRNVTIS